MRYALIFVVLLTGCTSKSPPPKPRPVRVHEVEAPTEGRRRTFPGIVQANVESRLSFRVEGSVLDLPVNTGQRVEAGGLIARLDARDYELQVQEAEAGLAHAHAEERLQSSNYARVRALYENKTASRNELDVSRAAAESTKAATQATEMRLELAQRRLAYTELRAPVTGSIADVYCEVSENVAAGTPIVRLTSGSSPEVVIAVPERLIHQVEVGALASVKIDAVKSQIFTGKITEVGVAAHAASTAFPVTIQMDRAPPEARSGMAAEVSLLFPNANVDTIVVPSVAVGEDAEGTHVFVVFEDDDGVFVQRTDVVVGQLTGEGMEVLSGLEPGELIATAGLRYLKDGQRVRLEEPLINSEARISQPPSAQTSTPPLDLPVKESHARSHAGLNQTPLQSASPRIDQRLQ